MRLNHRHLGLFLRRTLRLPRYQSSESKTHANTAVFHDIEFHASLFSQDDNGRAELECAKLTFEAPPPPSGAARWCTVCYGGATARPQLESLAGGVEILVATPGRLVDFVNRDLVSLADVRFLVRLGAAEPRA